MSRSSNYDNEMNALFIERLPGSLVLLVTVSSLAAAAVTPEQAQTNGPAARPALKASDIFGDTLLAKGKGVEVKRGQFDSEYIRTKAAIVSRGAMAPPDLEQQVLDGLISLQLILSKATEADKAKGKEQFEKSLANYKTEGKLSDKEFDEKLSPQLSLQGITREQWDKQQIEQTTIPVVLERELKVSVNDDEVKKFYDDNPAKFEEPEMLRASHILLKTTDSAGKELAEEKKAARRKQMEDLLKRARAGEDFAKLAKDFSEDPDSRDKGGEYKFPRGKMVPEFEGAAFALKPDQVSDIVTTQYGYHIIKLSEKIPAQKVELAKVAPRIKEYLKQEAIKKQLKSYMDTLKKEAAVEILDEKLKPKAESAALPATSAIPPGVK